LHQAANRVAIYQTEYVAKGGRRIHGNTFVLHGVVNAKGKVQEKGRNQRNHVKNWVKRYRSIFKRIERNQDGGESVAIVRR